MSCVSLPYNDFTKCCLLRLLRAGQPPRRLSSWFSLKSLMYGALACWYAETDAIFCAKYDHIVLVV